MKMKKLIALLLAVTMLLFVAVSCGKDKTTDKKEDKPSPAPATETAQETTKGGLQVDTEGGVVTFQW